MSLIVYFTKWFNSNNHQKRFFLASLKYITKWYSHIKIMEISIIWNLDLLYFFKLDILLLNYFHSFEYATCRFLGANFVVSEASLLVSYFKSLGYKLCFQRLIMVRERHWVLLWKQGFSEEVSLIITADSISENVFHLAEYGKGD